jgi:tRNA G18 (ribose-2'-O)-methylase SpoU
MREIVLVIHNVRSALNVGAIFRTAEGLGIKKVYLTGYTPYPIKDGDSRLPHLSKKIAAIIDKTALGAINSIDWEQRDNINDVVGILHGQNYSVVALEQTPESIPLVDLVSKNKLAIIVGNEVAGLDQAALREADICVFIPMFGKKESFNVASAAAMTIYHLRFMAE